MNGTNSYEERNSITYNQGEDIFLQWCRGKGLKVHRLGFDEKQDKVEHFYTLPSMVRNLPDYLVTDDTKAALVNVKGSMNFKAEEYARLDDLLYHYESDRCRLYYVFALPSRVTWLTVDEVRELYDKSTHKGRWPDGKEYRKL
jgi:hypothetical protein